MRCPHEHESRARVDGIAQREDEAVGDVFPNERSEHGNPLVVETVVEQEVARTTY
jgi:hypothetical protein